MGPGSPAGEVDAALFDVERKIDWLTTLSPVGNVERWRAFRDSGYRSLPALTYLPSALDLPALRERVQALPVDEIEHSAIRSLLSEKREELLQLVELLGQRDTEGFTLTSIALFGGADPSLLQVANEILRTVPRQVSEATSRLPLASSDDVMQAACALRDEYARHAGEFHFPIRLVHDLDSVLVVQQGTLCINSHLRLPMASVAPLLAHEVGVHVLTRYNGSRQPLRLFESGLAGYDVLQEGLATLSEYASGYLPPERLRVLAARVVAADFAVARHSPEDIFADLFETHGLTASDAFDVTVRAIRGGGFTKDAVYLQGLHDVLAYLRTGAEIEPLLVGKFSLTHRHLIESLLDEGFLSPPALVPDCFKGPEVAARLLDASRKPLDTFFHAEPMVLLH